MQVTPRKELLNLPKTVHGGQGWREQNVEDYSQNLNPMGPPHSLAEILSKAVSDAGHYPDADCAVLREKIGKYYGLGAENVTMGAGSSEIIRDFPFVFVNPGESVLIFTPSFAEYTQQCRIAGADIDYLPLRPENDFRIDTEELFGVLTSKHYKTLYICNPNNPTGRIENRAKLNEIIRKCEELETLVFLDETLLALVADEGKVSLSKYVNDFTNLIVAHSFTKSFAVPGLRVGFALANPAIISEMEKVKLPWNVGTAEQAAADFLITYEMSYVYEAAADMKHESVLMHSELDDIGFPIGKVSDSFFYFISLEELNMTGKIFKDLMLREGIMVRDCASFGPEYEKYVRFCVKDRERNEKFVQAVARIFKSMSH